MLTYWGQKKIDAMLQTAFSNAFSCMKSCLFWLNLTEIFSQCPNEQYTTIGSDNGLALNRRQAIIWPDGRLVTDAYMRHSASMS